MEDNLLRLELLLGMAGGIQGLALSLHLVLQLGHVCLSLGLQCGQGFLVLAAELGEGGGVSLAQAMEGFLNKIHQ